jgi:hypothetical protein
MCLTYSTGGEGGGAEAPKAPPWIRHCSWSMPINIMSMILLIICICICINTYTTYKISLAGFNSTPPMEESTYCQCWIAGLKLTTVFAFTISSSSWFQCITLLMNNEFLYCSVLHFWWRMSSCIAQYYTVDEEWVLVLLSITLLMKNEFLYCSVLHCWWTMSSCIAQYYTVDEEWVLVLLSITLLMNNEFLYCSV